uniref:Glycosyltransferase 2-like domain-containing protein n=1 Tax=viral metagenome TaxID=1070528 RepID=A0A6C0D9S4_9ZZZZ
MFQSTGLKSVTVLYNKSNKFGLENDAELIKRALSGKATVRFSDPLEHPVVQDINIHLEVPVYNYVPWASYNIFIMNPEWYVKDAWDPYLKNFDLVITKEQIEESFKLLPWSIQPISRIKTETIKEFLYLLGGSKNKREFAQFLIPFWKESYPTLHVYSVETLNLDSVPSNVKLYVEDLSKEQRQNLLHTYVGHVCCSSAEGFGYTAAEANYVNAFTVLNTLPVYVQDYHSSELVNWLNTRTKHSNDKCPYGSFVDYSSITNIQDELDTIMSKFESFVYTYKTKTETKFSSNLVELMNSVPLKKKMKTLPPILERNDCPSISVVTLIYNRRKFFDLAKHNMLLTDYPKDKIQWVIVDDSDDPEEQASDKIIQTQNTFSGMDIKYVPLLKKTPVSQKRNIGVENCDNDIVLFMDDDDHYPETSFRRRVAWLTRHPILKPKAITCTTIACYDLMKGISAVNCPPFDIPLGQRVSEATLTFYKDWFLNQKFEKNIQVGEGETTIKGRESEVLEIPPQQVIVAFSHGKNTSSRRIPASDGVTPSCFWGFPKEYLQFIHALAGIKVV